MDPWSSEAAAAGADGDAPPTAGEAVVTAGDDEGLLRLSRRLGHVFADIGLLRQALAHRSWCSEAGGAASNERLEFLGDAVLSLVVAEHGFDAYPELPEGALAKVRAAVVNTAVLAEVGAELDVGPHLLLGRGEDASGGRAKASILANTVEALIGAVYLDGGWAAASSLVLRLLGERIVVAANGPGAGDFKTRLQELVVRTSGELPRYEVVGSGPDHERHYKAVVLVGGEPWGTGEGRSKKDAEQAAAHRAWERLAADAVGTAGADAERVLGGDGGDA